MSRRDRPRAFLFDPGDFLADEKVQTMTPAECGAYIRLLCVAFGRTPAATLPDDDRLLALWAGMAPKEWQASKGSVMGPWERTPQGWVQGRLLASWESAERCRLRAKKGGRASGKSRTTRVEPKFNSSSTQDEQHISSCSSSCSSSLQGECEGDDLARESALRGGSAARVRIVKSHQSVRPSGANHGALILALPDALEAVVAAGAAPDYGAALEFIAERSERWARSAEATTTPRQYRPSMKTWLRERLLDDPEAWDVEYSAGKADAMAEANRRLEAM